MALNIRIDIENRYDFVQLDSDFRKSTFKSILVDGTAVELGIKVSTDTHPLMPDVYNLSFGPFDEVFNIDDQARLTHSDHAKVFSTIVFAALSFLNAHEGKYLGINGSTTARAYMYYRCIQNNYDYLKSLFKMYGVNYSFRILRSGIIKNSIDFTPKLILPGEKVPIDEFYNYFIFKKKSGI